MYTKVLDDWLIGAYVSLADSCNYNCIYCSEYNYIHRNSFLTYKSFKQVGMLLRQNKVCKLSLTGGEPFLNPDIKSIIDYALNYFSVSVLTNGSLLPGYVDYLSSIDNKNRIKFSVSVDSSRAEINQITRGENSWARSVQEIKCLVDLGYCVTILCTVTANTTQRDVEELVEMAKRLCVRGISFSPLNPSGLGRTSFSTLKPPTELLTWIDVNKEQLNIKYGVDVGSGYSACYDEIADVGKDYSLLPCRAGISQISIKANGDVFPCNALNIYMGNIFSDSMKYILHESEGATLIKKIKSSYIYANSECRKCKFSNSCTGGCRGIAYGFYNDGFAPSPYCDQYYN